MELGLGSTLLAGDPRLVDHIVGEVKSQGIFDQFRKECIADVDTKPAYQNLRTRVESSVNSFLNKQTWRADLNKNQLRETLRKHIHEAPYLDAGVERIVDQVVNPKVYSVFMPQIEDVVYKFLGLERPKNHQRNGPCGFKDLLPKDLDPVSPESDKNSLKDVSLDSMDANIDGGTFRETISNLTSNEKNSNDENEPVRGPTKNGNSDEPQKYVDETPKPLGNMLGGLNLNDSGKSEDKPEEEEEDSPMFEPIDIMNLNESNISNDSHLSGISELTSHRSQTPDFSNETSRDNMDFSNQDSQFSKVSSNSRLSIVTDFGSSNHASTPVSDVAKDDRDKTEGKYAKDNFKAIRDLETGKLKDEKSSYEVSPIKEETKGGRRSVSSKEASRDGTETSKDVRESKEKNRDTDSSRSKIGRDAKREKEARKKSTAETKTEKSKRPKEKTESSRDSLEKSKDTVVRPKEEKVKESEKKENVVGKEVKDLKDIYKEKIRELREKKELTEKEKLGKETKISKETRDKRDSSRDSKKDSKDHKSSSSKSHSSSRSETKACKSDGKGSRSESKGKRDERRHSKEHKSRNNGQGTSDSGDKTDVKRISRSEKDEKIEKSDAKQDSKQRSVGKSGKNDSGRSSDGKRDSKGEIENKDKKRREEKKSKTKDDHSSLRKNSDDRRSTDRDGSNGSNGKSSQKSNSSSSSSPTKIVSSSLSKESTTTSNSSSETSDSIEEKQNEKSIIISDSKNTQMTTHQATPSIDSDTTVKRLVIGQNEISLPIKKRPLTSEAAGGDLLMKKPKFAKNFQEAKRLMKVRRRMEKEKLKRQLEAEMNKEILEPASVEPAAEILKEDLPLVPDDERVQIIEVRDEEYDEPYPEIQSHFTLEERSQIILGGESIFTSDILAQRFNAKSTLSEMESSIRQSLNELISDNKIKETKEPPIKPRNSLEPDTESNIEETVAPEEETASLIANGTKDFPNAPKTLAKLTENIEDSFTQSDHQLKSENENCTEVTEIMDKCNERQRDNSLKIMDTEELGDSSSTELDGSPRLEIVEDDEIFGEIVEEKSEIKEINDGQAEDRNVVEAAAGFEDVAEKTEKEARKETIRAIVDAEETVQRETELEEGEKRLDIVEEESKGAGIVTETAESPEIVRGKFKSTDPIEQAGKSMEIISEEIKCTDTIGEASKSSKVVQETSQNAGTIEKREEATGIVPKGSNSSNIVYEKEQTTETFGERSKNTESLRERSPSDESVKEEEKEKIVDRIVEKVQTDGILNQAGNVKADMRKISNNVPATLTKKKPEENPKNLFDGSKSKCQNDPPACEMNSSSTSDDEGPCLYFVEDNARFKKLTEFMKIWENEVSSMEETEMSATEEQSVGISDSQVMSSVSKPMAPPKPKRKYSTSPLTDILLNNTNNNNDAHKIMEPVIAVEDGANSLKKRKIGRPKKQRINATLCNQQNLSNGENFVMPLSPESDVSATSEKTPSNPLKDEKSRPRGSNQRYTSDDLYKPRPLFSSSSRRSRRSNQA